MLSGLVEMARTIEASIDGLLAARDGVLALASRVALSQTSDADDADLQVRVVAAELGAALRLSDRTIQRRMVAAEVKVDRFPAVWAAQGAGRISASHARVIVDAGERIEETCARAAYAQRMVAFAEGESPNRTRVVAERIAEQCRPRSLQERHEDAREQRSAWVKDHPDAMAELGLYGPAVLVHAAFERLTGMGKEVKKRTSPGAGGEGPDAEPRTLGQLRADLALDLLLTGAPAGHDTPDGVLAAVDGHVSITVPVLALMAAEGDSSRALNAAVGAGTSPRQSSQGVPRSTRPPPGCWRVRHPGGIGCSLTRSAESSSLWTGTDPPSSSDATCVPGTSAAGSPAVACRLAIPTSTTPSTPPTADPRKRATSRLCAAGTMC